MIEKYYGGETGSLCIAEFYWDNLTFIDLSPILVLQVPSSDTEGEHGT
jgi:hypothetical protein